MSEAVQECVYCGNKHKIVILIDSFGRYRLGIVCARNGKPDYLSGSMTTYDEALTELEVIKFLYFDD